MSGNFSCRLPLQEKVESHCCIVVVVVVVVVAIVVYLHMKSLFISFKIRNTGYS